VSTTCAFSFPLTGVERDGEEYNLIGSTEHVEARMAELRRNGVAYLNVDVAVTGSDFEASASPILQTALLRVLERVADPVSNKTLRAIWAEKGSTLKGLGAGSDYVAFQDMAGTSSLDMGFSGPGFPYHSCYDNFDWMEKFGDPEFQYHRTMAQVWALLILEVADRELLPFDFEVYASAVKGYVDDLEGYAKVKGAEDEKFALTVLHQAADEFKKNAEEFQAWGKAWEDAVGQGGFESKVMAIKRMSHNSRMGNFETNLLDIDGGVSKGWIPLCTRLDLTVHL
jgi:N-acetylated-alpha-linked acidic dipeptidase